MLCFIIILTLALEGERAATLAQRQRRGVWEGLLPVLARTAPKTPLTDGEPGGVVLSCCVQKECGSGQGWVGWRNLRRWLGGSGVLVNSDNDYMLLSEICAFNGSLILNYRDKVEPCF